MAEFEDDVPRDGEPIDWSAALARLLYDAEMRDAFRQDRASVVRRMNLRRADAALAEQIDPDQLEAQARTLLVKRRYEVSLLLPRTFEALADQAAELFEAYAGECPPGPNLPHPTDALRFGAYLRRRGVRALDRLELNRVRFVERGARCRVHPVHIPPDASRSRPRQCGLQLLMRFRGRCVQRRIGLVLPF